MTKLELTDDELEYMSSRTGIRYPEMRSKHEAGTVPRPAVSVPADELERLREDAAKYEYLRRLDHFAIVDELLDRGCTTLDKAVNLARKMIP